MMLWFLGALTLSSAFMIGGFSRAAWKNRKPVSRWNIALVLAASLDLHAVAMSVATGVRTYDVWTGNQSLATSETIILFISYGALLTAKIGLVWVAAVEDAELKTVSPLWPAFLGAQGVWGVMAFLH